MKLTSVALLALCFAAYGEVTAAPPSQPMGCQISVEPKTWGMTSTVVAAPHSPELHNRPAVIQYTAKRVEIRIGTSVLQADEAAVELAQSTDRLANVQLTGNVRLRAPLTLEQLFAR